jgi:serine/threonine protein kinase
MAAKMNHPPTDSGRDRTAAAIPAPSTEQSDDATRVISPAKSPSLEPNNATVIVSPKSVPALAVPTPSGTQFPVTRAAPPGASAPASAVQAAATATDSSLLPIGTRVAEFEITRLIGQGGFGVVYEAWDHTLERVVAIKEYMPSSLANRQADGSVVPLSERHKETFDLGMRSFINEARLLAQFDHPALLKVYRFWQERGTTYMVMPCYKGDTLKEALLAKKEQVNEEWLMGIIDGVTQALAVMHRASCYHRDIAPDNILLLENSGLPVVLDFGAARRVITDMTQAITVILKPGYAPIEQYAETPDMSQGAWTDVYALSAVMHVAITGRSPPPSVARMLNDRYVPLAGNAALHNRFSDRLLAAVDAGLSVRPEARPQSMAQFRMSLDLPNVDEATTAQTTKAMSAKSTGASPPFAKASDKQLPTEQQGKKSPVALSVAAVAGLAVAAAGVWWWSGKPAPDLPSVGPASSSPAAQITQAAAVVTKPVPTPSAVSAIPFSASQSLGNLQQTSTGGVEVSAKPGKPEVRIGKDRLEFQIQSNKAGFAYVYLLNTVGELYLLFPNALDKRNRIEPGAALSLPKTSWAMNSDGPAGTDEFVVLVSEYERDFKTTGIQYEGVFGQFSLKILEALEAARGTGPSPLLGQAICPGATPCADNYGVASFKIIEK